MVNNTFNQWSRNQDKLFEQAIVLYPENTPYRWEKMAGEIGGKSAEEIEKHYEDLVYDVTEIESGRIQVPRYEELESSSFWMNTVSFGGKEKEREAERRKGVPWTEEEHRLFLIGLERYGKGDWRSISRNAVVSRTPTQVASHAQKYFLRLAASSIKKDKKRSSIHDITMANETKNDHKWIGPMDPWTHLST